jgi:hypothetical protein
VMPISAPIAAAIPVQTAPPPPPPPPQMPQAVAAVPPSQVPHQAAAAPPPQVTSSSPAKWLWLMIPLAALMIGGAVLLTLFLPKFLHRNDAVPAPVPVVDTTPVPQNPDQAANPPANPDNANPPANPDNAAPTATTPATDSGTATATDSGTAPATDAPAPDGAPVVAYDTLTSQGVSFIAAGDTDSAVNVYLQAIKLQPKSPKAYAALGELYMYTIGNLPEALRYYHAAIARGGVVTFHVHHDRGGGNFTVASDGRLQVSNGSVAFVGGNDSFRASKGEVKEAKRNKMVGMFAHGQVSVSAFHIKLESGKNYNFAPGSNFSEAERDLILNLIGKG